jgi:phosphoribosyl-ATP pyrophosphohydrolase
VPSLTGKALESLMSATPEFDDVLPRLARLIGTRRGEAAGTSYTKELLDAGVERCARKLGEESIETIVAALGGDRQALTREAADLVYHLLVLLESRQVGLEDVLKELRSRMGTSGLAEKAARRGGSA